MELNMVIIFAILLIHWIADFILQSDHQAKNKATSFKSLVQHTAIYSACWLVVGLIGMWFNVFTLIGVVSFVGITFVVHTITDYFTSKINKQLFEKGDTHNLFVSIGADQVLHYVQLFLTYSFLML